MNAVTSTLGKPSKPGAFKWLIKREFWENRGGFFWAPVITGGIFLVLNLILAVIGSIAARRSMDGGGFVIDDAPEKAHQIVGGIGDGMLLGGVILACVVLAFVVFFYALGTLYDDRRDRSVLFWKSLPVSDAQTVLSKVAIALLVAPLIVAAAASLTSLALVLILSGVLAANGIHVFAELLATPGLYLGPLRVFGLLPVYCLWALPTVGWLLMVSSWARSKVFLWAVGVPLLLLILTVWLGKLTLTENDINWIQMNVIGRALLGTIPGSWYLFEPELLPQVQAMAQGAPLPRVDIFSNSWSSLALPATWLGAAAGAALLYAAIRLRSWREEN